MNQIIEGHKRLDEWFKEVERVLNKNHEVIDNLSVPKVKEVDNASLNGTN